MKLLSKCKKSGDICAIRVRHLLLFSSVISEHDSKPLRHRATNGAQIVLKSPLVYTRDLKMVRLCFGVTCSNLQLLQMYYLLNLHVMHPLLLILI